MNRHIEDQPLVSGENGKLKRSYRKWSAMLRRCYKPNTSNYPRYGGRGIKVCDRWHVGNDGYQNFLADMGEPPPGLTLGRKDDNGDYTPENCEWQTWKQQAQNRAPRGPTKSSLRQGALAAGLPYMVVYLRVKRLGWNLQRALTTPKQHRGGWRGNIKGGVVGAMIALGTAKPDYAGSESDVNALLKRLAAGESVEAVKTSMPVPSAGNPTDVTGLPEMPTSPAPSADTAPCIVSDGSPDMAGTILHERSDL